MFSVLLVWAVECREGTSHGALKGEPGKTSKRSEASLGLRALLEGKFQAKGNAQTEGPMERLQLQSM